MRALSVFVLALLLGVAAAGTATWGHHHHHCSERRCRDCACKCPEDSCEERPPLVGYYPTVKAISGSSQFFPIGPIKKSFGDIKCPSGYAFTTADSEIEIARNIIDAYFVQKVAPTLKTGNAYWCKTYLYPNGQVVGTIHSGLSATILPKHYSVTGCFADKMKRGVTYYGFGQGVLNYKCKEDGRGTIKQVALVLSKGQFTAQ